MAEKSHTVVETANLTGRVLDHAVARAIGLDCEVGSEPNFSTDWNLGGPLLEAHAAKVFKNMSGTWTGMLDHCYATGPNPLIATMRVIVRKKLGDDVKIPKGI